MAREEGAYNGEEARDHEDCAGEDEPLGVALSFIVSSRSVVLVKSELTSLAVIPSISLKRAVAGMKTVRSMMTTTMARIKAMMEMPMLSMPDFWIRKSREVGEPR